MSHRVSLVEFFGVPQAEHAIYIHDTGSDGACTSISVTGSLEYGMWYEKRTGQEPPPRTLGYLGMSQIGWVSEDDIFEMDKACRSIPVPAKQGKGGKRRNLDEPIRRSQDWTAEAIQKLRDQGILKASKPA